MKLKVRVKNEHKPTIEELMYTHPFESEDENTWKSNIHSEMNWKSNIHSEMNWKSDIHSEMNEINDHEEEDLKILKDKQKAKEDLDYLKYICGKMDSLDIKNLGGIEEVKFEDEEDVDWEKAYKELLNEYIDIYVKLKELESFKESVKNLAEQTKQECLKEKAEKSITEEEIKDLLDTKVSYIINSICTCIITPDNIGSKINFRYSIYDFIKYVVKYIDFFRE